MSNEEISISQMIKGAAYATVGNKAADSIERLVGLRDASGNLVRGNAKKRDISPEGIDAQRISSGKSEKITR